MKTGVLAWFFLLLSLSAGAHNFWLQPVPQGVRLCLGDGQDEEGYDLSKVDQTQAFDSQGAPLPCQQDSSGQRLQLLCPQAAAFAVRADYGVWIKTIHGWHPGSKRDSGDRVLKSMWSVHYCKLVKPNGVGLKLGLPLEIVLTKCGPDQVEGQVLWQGQPRPQCRLFHGHEHAGRTDDQGAFRLERSPGPWLLSAEVEEALVEHPDVDLKVSTGTLTLVP